MALAPRRLATSTVLFALFVAGCGPFDDASPLSTVQSDLLNPSVQSSPATRLDVETAVEPVPARPAAPRGEPARVVIPAIDVAADLIGVGLAKDGSMEVPDFGLAGWYTEGPRPGHTGPAVIAAHVDSKAGPDVFYRLDDLARGDEIRVVYDSGDQVTFVVESSEQTPKDELPVDTIWPITRERLLTLVTCGGQFDRGTGHYRDNVIVYAAPKPPR
jgi:sortase (surface protein transpeptidase)